MIALFLSLLSLVSARQIALYFGQSNSKPLIDYCADDSADIFILSFLDKFGAGRENNINIYDDSGDYNGTISDGAGNSFLNDLSGQIQWCQRKGKKVLLSLGGSQESYGFSSAGDASGFASCLCDAFLGGSGVSRPFNTAKLDGLDLDIEAANDGDPALYINFVNELRNLYSTDSSKQYYVSAAPQPPLYYDDLLRDVIDNSWFDYLFIQCYNQSPDFNLGEDAFEQGWESYTNKLKDWKNPNVQLFVGLPGDSAAGEGYVPIYKIKGDLGSGILNSPSFGGGFMVWEAGEETTVDGKSYSQALRGLL